MDLFSARERPRSLGRARRNVPMCRRKRKEEDSGEVAHKRTQRQAEVGICLYMDAAGRTTRSWRKEGKVTGVCIQLFMYIYANAPCTIGNMI